MEEHNVGDVLGGNWVIQWYTIEQGDCIGRGSFGKVGLNRYFQSFALTCLPATRTPFHLPSSSGHPAPGGPM